MNMIFVLTNCFLMGLILIMFLFLVINGIRKRINLMGRPPIHRFVFVASKICNFLCWILFIIRLIEYLLKPYPISIWPLILSLISLFISTALVVLSFRGLGDLNKFGLPSGKSVLLDRGVYAFSRNPMYLGFYFLNISSMLFYFHIINIIMGLTGILIHHMIVLGEEKYLSNSFGEQWAVYTNKVRRYF
jgi:protein-S-isoprenylcysteine O-methyltransferase Ste14